ncbi:sterol desaturase family protein [Aliamphritea spongicola]|uniref:sterol desaturase family protein n=1 Tax=Aliamphritea spongicola TaxID=707589 RepID=UPI00196B938F|nr:sterol desaturase family protein [Aliamphritea spongicola]MBN3564286.1 sterol desaturase family protein [Aliamphritea spongicola]
MLSRIFKDDTFQFGAGNISGYIACLLAVLSFLGVLAFHFPQYLTTPELRQAYDVEFLRQLMFWSMVLAGSLGLLNFVRNRQKRMGAFAWVFLILTIMLGGHQVEVGEFTTPTLYLGMDWFILDLLGSTLVFIFIEKLIPHNRQQAVLRPEWQGDLNHFFVNHLIVGFVLLVTNLFVHKAFGWAVFSEVQDFIAGLPLAVQIFLIVLAADLVQYSAHRAYHEVPVLWRFHAVHHSAKHMDWLAGSRQHILELIATRCLVLTPIFVLGFSKEVIDIYVIIVGLQAVFNHANVNVKFGWLKYIIVTPQFHHWHHSSDDAAIDRNYAAHFAFLDYLFGTAVRGQKEWPDAYGVVGDYVPVGMFRQQLFPFQSVTRMVKAKFRARAERDRQQG